MADQEGTRDKLLQIKTIGRDDTGADQYHHPYEPTPYSVLERLAGSGLIEKDDVVLDYGCGTGRVGFFCLIGQKHRPLELNMMNEFIAMR